MRGWVRIRRSDVGSLYTCLATSATPLLLGPSVQELAHALVRGRAGVSIRMWGNDSVRRTSRESQSSQEQTSKCNYANLTRWGDTSSVEQLMRAGCSTRLM